MSDASTEKMDNVSKANKHQLCKSSKCSHPQTPTGSTRTVNNTTPTSTTNTWTFNGHPVPFIQSKSNRVLLKIQFLRFMWRSICIIREVCINTPSNRADNHILSQPETMSLGKYFSNRRVMLSLSWTPSSWTPQITTNEWLQTRFHFPALSSSFDLSAWTKSSTTTKYITNRPRQTQDVSLS